MTFLDNWAVGVGFFAVTVMLYRMFLTMEQEFSDEEEIVQDPLAYAVKTTLTFSEFQANSWKAFNALATATRFRTFYRTFRVLIDPRLSQLCALFLLGAFVLMIVVAGIAQFDSRINNMIGGTFALAAGLWWAVIDRGKTLKKSVERLRLR